MIACIILSLQVWCSCTGATTGCIIHEQLSPSASIFTSPGPRFFYFLFLFCHSLLSLIASYQSCFDLTLLSETTCYELDVFQKLSLVKHILRRIYKQYFQYTWQSKIFNRYIHSISGLDLLAESHSLNQNYFTLKTQINVFRIVGFLWLFNR